MDRVRRAALVAIVASGLTSAPSAIAAPAPAAYAPGELIVKYADRASSSQRLLAGKTAGVLETLGRITGAGAQLVRVTGDPAKVAARLNRSGAVLYAEPNYIYRATALPNDPRFAEQYALNNSAQNGGVADADIDAPEGWDGAFGATPFATPQSGVKIGIVDTGVQVAHEDLSGKVVNCAGVRSFGILLGLFADPTIVANRCADDNGHGTHVAGTAAANTNNARGVAGVAFNAPLAICKALDRLGSGTLAGVANCIVYLAGSGAKVISMSLSGPQSVTMKNAVGSANRTALLLAAAGNAGNETLNYPAGYPEVVSVAAVDRNGARAAFSTFNADVEVAAPGVDILSTWINGSYRSISGTSMAAPHAAGVGAIIAARTPGGPSAWRAKLASAAAVDDIAPAGRDPQTGFGRVNLAQATAP